MCLQCWFYTKKILKLYKGARHRPNAHPKPDWCSPAARFLILIPVSTSTHRYNDTHIYTRTGTQTDNYQSPLWEIADKICDRAAGLMLFGSIGGGVSICLYLSIQIQFLTKISLEKDRVQASSYRDKDESNWNSKWIVLKLPEKRESFYSKYKKRVLFFPFLFLQYTFDQHSRLGPCSKKNRYTSPLIVIHLQIYRLSMIISKIFRSS